MTNYKIQDYEDYEKDKAIIVDAPEGATHYDDENNYWILTANQNIQEKVFETSKNKWVNCPIKGFSFQSLNDLRQKIALYEQLQEANARIAELEKEAEQGKLIFVGYTNGYQIEYAKEDEGAFYPDTDNDCYVPLYMLSVHKHRAEIFKGGNDE